MTYSRPASILPPPVAAALPSDWDVGESGSEGDSGAESGDEVDFRQLRHHSKNALQRILCEIAKAAELEHSARGRRLFSDLERRVQLSATISDALFGFTHAPESIGLRLQSLCESVVELLAEPQQRIDLRVTAAGDCPRGVGATVLRVANEMVGNAVKHGMRGRTAGRIGVHLSCEPRAIRLTIKDDGPGPDDSAAVGEGRWLIDELVQAHHGTSSLWRDGMTTIAEVIVPRSGFGQPISLPRTGVAERSALR